MLENLKKDWIAETKKLLDLVKYAKINITFDLDHAVLNPLIKIKVLSLVQIFPR